MIVSLAGEILKKDPDAVDALRLSAFASQESVTGDGNHALARRIRAALLIVDFGEKCLSLGARDRLVKSSLLRGLNPRMVMEFYGEHSVVGNVTDRAIELIRDHFGNTVYTALRLSSITVSKGFVPVCVDEYSWIVNAAHFIDTANSVEYGRHIPNHVDVAELFLKMVSVVRMGMRDKFEDELRSIIVKNGGSV